MYAAAQTNDRFLKNICRVLLAALSLYPPVAFGEIVKLANESM